MAIKRWLDPVRVVWIVLATGLFLIWANPILFGPKYLDVSLMNQNGLFWILGMAATFTLGALTEKTGRKRSEQIVQVPADKLRQMVMVFQVTHRLVWFLSVVAFANTLVYFLLAVRAAGSLQTAFRLLAGQGSVWRSQYVIYLDVWNGWFIPSELTPALLLYCLAGFAVVWCYTHQKSDKDHDAIHIARLWQSTRRTAGLTMVTTVLKALLLLDRLTLLFTVLPASICALILISRSYPGWGGVRGFLHRYRWVIVASIVIAVFVSASNFASRVGRVSAVELLSLDYFITNLANANYYINSTVTHSYGFTSISQFLHVLRIPSPSSVFVSSRNVSDYELSILSNQAAMVWVYAWADFGPFGIVYTWILGFVSSLLYGKAWTNFSLWSIGLGAMICEVWILSFHVFQLILVTFWLNLFTLFFVFRYAERRLKSDFVSKRSSILPSTQRRAL